MMRISLERAALMAALAFIVGGSLPYAPFVERADAAPGDIYGSPNVAVSSFRTEGGSYILYSDGTVADAESGQSLGREYEQGTPANIKLPPKVAKKQQGSPNIAVDTVETPEGTYVLFADGGVRKHKAVGASASPVIPRSSRGFYNANTTDLLYATPDTRVTGGGGTYTVYFDPPYDEFPNFVLTPVESGVVGYVNYNSNPRPPIYRVDVAFRNTDGDLNPSSFNFSVSGK